MPDKYVVFKIEDVEDLGVLYDKVLMGRAVHDAVVIRKKDTFAASALYAYATSVLSAVDIMEASQEGVIVDPSVIQRLKDLADFFAGEADHARQLHGRIPD